MDLWKPQIPETGEIGKQRMTGMKRPSLFFTTSRRCDGLRLGLSSLPPLTAFFLPCRSLVVRTASSRA